MKKIILIFIFLNSFLFAQIPQYTVVPLTYPPTGQQINQDSAMVFDTIWVRYQSANSDTVFWNNIGWNYYPEALYLSGKWFF